MPSPLRPRLSASLVPSRWCRALLFAALASPLFAAVSSPAQVGEALPLWSEGHLDIHHINTGKGESAFLLLPDGTTLLVDAGAAPTSPPWGLLARPDGSRAPGEWIARYILRQIKPLSEKRIDYALISHFHWDHMGDIAVNAPLSSTGEYQLGGITEVAEHIAIHRLIDRNWPNYDWPVPLDDRKMENYRKFIAWQTRHAGLVVERLRVGHNDQFRLVHRAAQYPTFEIRNLVANGDVWMGKGKEVQAHFPPLSRLEKENYPSENKSSCAIRIRYGKFDYFTGGDLDEKDVEFAIPGEEWKDIEPPVARASGPVDVLKANHHANYDANGVAFLRTLQPRIIVASTWGVSQPAMNVYRRMLSSLTYPGPRDVFFTNATAATLAALHIDQLNNATGHIVVRVLPSGAEYFVYAIEDRDESFRIKAVYGPYSSR
jgi:beta-lactamase superfamily II metal-dependent hydrolase